MPGIRSDGTQSYTKNAQSYTENRAFFSFFSVKLRDFSVNLCVTERLPCRFVVKIYGRYTQPHTTLAIQFAQMHTEVNMQKHKITLEYCVP